MSNIPPSEEFLPALRKFFERLRVLTDDEKPRREPILAFLSNCCKFWQAERGLYKDANAGEGSVDDFLCRLVHYSDSMQYAEEQLNFLGTITAQSEAASQSSINPWANSMPPEVQYILEGGVAWKDIGAPFFLAVISDRILSNAQAASFDWREIRASKSTARDTILKILEHINAVDCSLATKDINCLWMLLEYWIHNMKRQLVPDCLVETCRASCRKPLRCKELVETVFPIIHGRCFLQIAKICKVSLFDSMFDAVIAPVSSLPVYFEQKEERSPDARDECRSGNPPFQKRRSQTDSGAISAPGIFHSLPHILCKS